MSKQLMPTKGSNAYQIPQAVCEETCDHAVISSEELNAYQLLQMRHDETYHPEILVLGVSRRMNHVTLHLIKYLNALYSLPASASENKRALIDSFIMIVSASNLLGISLAKNLAAEQPANKNREFIGEYLRLLAELAKACEATDHQEDYPIRATWNKNIQSFFFLILREATLHNISLLEEAIYRLTSVERKHPLDDILRENK